MTKKQTPEQKIRRLHASGRTVREIAKLSGVSKSTVGNVIRGSDLSDRTRRKASAALADVRIPKTEEEKKPRPARREQIGSVVVWSPEGDEYEDDPDAINVTFLRPGERLTGKRKELWRYSGRLGKPLGSRQEASLREILEERGAGAKAIRDTIYNVSSAKRNDFTDKFAAKRAVKLGTTPAKRRSILKKAGIQITEKYDLDYFVKTGILKER